MGQLDRDKTDRTSGKRADLEQQISELKELIHLLQFAAEEVADSQKEIRKSLEKLKKFMDKDQVTDL